MILEVYNDKETKTEKLKRKLKEEAKKAKDFVVQNKEALLLIAPAAIVKAVGKRVNLSKEEELKNKYCYDRSLGHYWSLNRELTNHEWTEIDKRKRNGERMADILDEFRVLK